MGLYRLFVTTPGGPSIAERERPIVLEIDLDDVESIVFPDVIQTGDVSIGGTTSWPRPKDCDPKSHSASEPLDLAVRSVALRVVGDLAESWVSALSSTSS
jgi:hypothetical protein